MSDEFDPTKTFASEEEMLEAKYDPEPVIQAAEQEAILRGPDAPAEPLEPEEAWIPPPDMDPKEEAILTLAQREALKLARMNPEQRARYDKATEELMANPAIAAFMEEEERRRAAKADMQTAFLAAFKKKKEKT